MIPTAVRHAEYLEQAEYCERMAQRATTPEMRADWLRLATRWLALLPHKEQSVTGRVGEMLREWGARQKNTTSTC